MLMNHLCKPPAWVPFTVERGTNSEAIVGQIQRSPVLLVLLWYPESTDFDHPTQKKSIPRSTDTQLNHHHVTWERDINHTVKDRY
jgi:hypothetical protein